MPASKAQQKAVNKYVKANYDLYQIKMPKGKKDDIKAVAAAAGESMNQYIINAIDQRTAQEAIGQLAVAGVVSLPSETLEAAQRAAEAAGETVPQFIERAVETQAQEDTRVRLNEDRQDQTATALVREIEDTELLVTSTLWGNVFYNDKLYRKPKDAQKVRDALMECRQRIGAMLDNLIEKIGSQGIKPDRSG